MRTREMVVGREEVGGVYRGLGSLGDEAHFECELFRIEAVTTLGGMWDADGCDGRIGERTMCWRWCGCAGMSGRGERKEGVTWSMMIKG